MCSDRVHKWERTCTVHHMTPSDYLTLEEVAEIIRVSPWTVKRRIAAGEIDAHNFGTGRRRILRVTRAEVERYAATNKAA